MSWAIVATTRIWQPLVLPGRKKASLIRSLYGQNILGGAHRLDGEKQSNERLMELESGFLNVFSRGQNSYE